jgi:hypothetical protein
MTDIIPRIPAYSNEAMWRQCETLKSIVTVFTEVKVGKGRNIETIKVQKHNIDKDTLNRIVNSCEYYKNLYEMEGKIQFRDYQEDIIKKGSQILDKHGFLYLAMEVRTGKTLTSLGIAEMIKSCKVLFITKKKAISTIEADYNMLNPAYLLTVINYESLHLVMDKEHWDLIICDEAHSCFLEDTLIDGIKIKDIELGSFQKCFNFTKGVYEYKKVLNVFKNPLVENLIKIKCNGKEIVCTESHEIFTKRGWIRAGELLPTDELQVL